MFRFNKGRVIGKSYLSFIILLDKISQGLDCVVATSNLEQYKSDFLKATGKELLLKQRDTSKIYYTATLISYNGGLGTPF